MKLVSEEITASAAEVASPHHWGSVIPSHIPVLPHLCGSSIPSHPCDSIISSHIIAALSPSSYHCSAITPPPSLQLHHLSLHFCDSILPSLWLHHPSLHPCGPIVPFFVPALHCPFPRPYRTSIPCGFIPCLYVLVSPSSMSTPCSFFNKGDASLSPAFYLHARLDNFTWIPFCHMAAPPFRMMG